MTKETDKQPSANRRNVLKGLGLALGGSVAGNVTGAFAKSQPAPQTVEHHVTDAPVGSNGFHQRQPFYGIHQSGITNARPAHGLVASFDVLVKTPDDLERLFRTLTQRIAFLTQGGTPPELDPKLPPADSGIIGPEIRPDNLTMTVGLGDSLFEHHPWLQPHKPKLLQRMTKFPNDALVNDLCHGDLSLQFCANTPDTNIHALRDILKTMSDMMFLRWKQEGNVPVIPPSPNGEVESARNFLGFRDGSANPDAGDKSLMNQLVWVGEAHQEPQWAMNGSYQAVRIIRNFVERWDRTPLQEQEMIFGRKKHSGAPLDGTKESQVPDYTKDPEGKVTPMDAHIRLANDRSHAAQKNLLLRRPFNYSNGVTKSGQLDQGLLFICYQADLEQGFITVQSRLDGEPLEEYIKPVGGGYFYILPGAVSEKDYLGSTLVEAIRNHPDNKV
ncbi:iron uptake transporter deferrochelatase/peroxidase subunit [Pseudochrobactrum kiredjianiae]|uniref:Deferrochelatase n=1 Tax=Pseudochrobactrum kiredjianiae TaxID=386305 RepID=A0ABW3V3J2_9HYPH